MDIEELKRTLYDLNDDDPNVVKPAVIAVLFHIITEGLGQLKRIADAAERANPPYKPVGEQ